MKAKTIWIIVGVVVLILILANWNKIFGNPDKKRQGGGVATRKPSGRRTHLIDTNPTAKSKCLCNSKTCPDGYCGGEDGCWCIETILTN